MAITVLELRYELLYLMTSFCYIAARRVLGFLISAYQPTWLSFDSNETVLRDAFSKHGDIIEVRVICDHVTGKSKGYGFVKFASEDSAASALKEMNDQVGFLSLSHTILKLNFPCLLSTYDLEAKCLAAQQVLDGRSIRVYHAHKN
ncbi:uncharacterized protein LOC130820961 isoform X4 [Amaranthus tricolor]|uniref:uncharacterized protein LOC130820961 isoform X4 n=1 Tax=Amaranthus tricolor TaxID=29722 RepID=UPI00258A355E|nr:uncharacterized protein LOC130820961 isoform X4 [Amaranthus tricolor]